MSASHIDSVSTPPDLPATDRDVRYRVYQHFIRTGRAPPVHELAALLDADASVVHASLERLAAAHALVLDPKSGEVRMAHPFSAVPTMYPVRTRRRVYWANCAWDVLGIPVLLGEDTITVTQCVDCGEELTLEVVDGNVHSNGDVVHFLVPARDFWRDIGFT